MFSERLYYEIKLMGKRVILTPLVVMGGFALLAVLLHILRVAPARVLSAGLEMILPLMAGVVTAAITSQDAAIELQLTVPKEYDRTVMGRLLLIVIWTACIAFLASTIIALLGLSFLPQQIPPWPALLRFGIGQLVWLAPLLWFVAVGLCLAMLIRSRAATTALLSGVWIIEIVFKDYFAAIDWLHPVFLFPTTLLSLVGPLPAKYLNLWFTNRYELIGTAIIVLVIGWLLLHFPEGLLKGSGEE